MSDLIGILLPLDLLRPVYDARRGIGGAGLEVAESVLDAADGARVDLDLCMEGRERV